MPLSKTPLAPSGTLVGQAPLRDAECLPSFELPQREAKQGPFDFLGYTFFNMEKLMRRACAVAFTLFWAATLLCQDKQTNWAAVSNDPDIQYRYQMFSRAKACYLEFRDQKQGKKSTTFDVVVSYDSTDLTPDSKPIRKTENEHIVTVATHTGTSRIPGCSAVVDAKVDFLERH
jgi:hypothetical protein